MKTYLKRVADQLLLEKLESKGAVLIEGAKWCGKTTTAAQVAQSILYMQDPRQKAQNLRLAELDPSLLLQGPTPRLIDEWQLAPSLWDAVRFEVDQRDEFNQFILTGSSVPNIDMSTSHSGVGRISRMTMRPMSLFESDDSNGQVSLQALFENKRKVSAKSEADINQIAYLICRGGWPRTVGLPQNIALRQAVDYVDTLVNSDISQVDGISKNPQRAKLLLKAFSRYISTDAAYSKLRDEIAVNDLDSLSMETVYSYINALKRLFVIEDMPAWNPNLRSKTAIRTSDTHHFVDPSIAAASMGIGPNDLIGDLNTMGLLFESLCVRDLRIFAESLNGEVYHYRDKTGLECDAVVHLRDGSYGLIEVKLGGKEVDLAAEHLISLKSKIDTNKMKSPAFLMILTAANYAYQRDDGVLVIPITCLKN